MAKSSSNNVKKPLLASVDIDEDYIQHLSPILLNILLRDHSSKYYAEQKSGHEENPDFFRIIWASHDYRDLGESYRFERQITPELITGDNNRVIMPRVVKSRVVQAARVRQMAEVFTPAWVCNVQNNLIDEAWFGRRDVFNTELPNHTWKANTDKVVFPEGKTWRDYIHDPRLEITCGEAPYLTSRYDTSTGLTISVTQRIGLLDRKLRVVSENTDISGDWLKWAKYALQSIYGYEWQGDSLLLARENLLFTFYDHYVDKFGKEPLNKSLEQAAYIISWNLWQMDGLKYTIPVSSIDETLLEKYQQEERRRREEAAQGQFNLFTGRVGEENTVEGQIPFCVIRNWNKSGNDAIEKFVKSIKQ
ncbi:MAG: restriction endonuclease subunit M [Bacteroidales bacterium]|nr:restriction endonuclease subunit M [Bacteroidales bacterium]